MSNATELNRLLETSERDQNVQQSDSLSKRSEPSTVDAVSEIKADTPISRYHIMTIIVIFIGYSGRNALLDMTPVLSTRLYVDMDLTPQQESALATVTFIGMTMSYLITGWIANVVGRKACAVWGTVWTLFWNAVCAFSWNIESLIAFRFMWSLASCSMSPLDMHVCEVIPSKYTWTAILISLYGGEAMGKLLPYLAGLAMLSNSGKNSWRYFVMALSIPSILFIGLAIVFIHDSSIYVLSMSKTDEAGQNLEKIKSKGSYSKLVDCENCKQSDDQSEIEHERLQNLKYVWKNKYLLRSLICITVIGFSVKYSSHQLSYIVTELVFLSGQTDSDYCSGTESNTYLLQESDYLLLSGYMVGAFGLKIIAMSIAQKFNQNLKLTGGVCQAVAICVAACLYLCPKYWIALIIYAVIDAASEVVELYFIIILTAEIVPIQIRSKVYGFIVFVMYIPLATTPYLVQVLTKRSQHYLTTTTISFVTISFISVLMLPKKEKNISDS